jgi:peptide/nickel transport system ATP-binding protein
MTQLYEVQGLTVDLFTMHSTVRPVDEVSYGLKAGECLAIVGESGSGKTVMNFSPLGLLPPGVSTEMKGKVLLDGRNLIGMEESSLAKLRGKDIGVIFQDPMTALNPARRIGRQIAEVCELHLGMTNQQANTRALELLKLAGMSDPESRLRQYPHELSGGLCQRVMIAIAIAAEPKLLIADEATTALDVTVQAQILRLLRDLRTRLGMAMVLITHDIGVVAGSADRVAVMYAGRIAEQGSVIDVLTAPRHPYTRALVAAIPQASDKVGNAFRGISGAPPILAGPVNGCAFAPRCTQVIDLCKSQRPPMKTAHSGATSVACHALEILERVA